MTENGNSNDMPQENSRERRHSRANRLQAENLRGAYRRAVHAAYIESVLSRTGHEVPSDREDAVRPSARSIDR